MPRKPILLALLAVVGLTALPARGQAARPAWEEELREMGYLIFHLSNINVVNGLNLTGEQATRLRDLALQMEAVADPPPAFTVKLRPEIEAIRKTYLEAREVLLKGQPVTADLSARVGSARVAETKFIRATLRPRPSATDPGCAACHTEPGTGSGEPMAPTGLTAATMGLAHIRAPYGTRGLLKVASVSPQVEATLTDAQKAILGSFSCCLIPPQDLSDPVRAGQAESGSKEIELLTKVRQIPENAWPFWRGVILQTTEEVTTYVSPGATAQRKAVAREAVAKAVDRARTLSDVEFELEKTDLARAAKAALMPPQADSPHKAAFFLLMPGASHVYSCHLDRLAKRAGTKVP